MSRVLSSLAFLMISLPATPLMASEQVGQFYVDGLFTGAIADDDRGVDDDFDFAGGGLALGYAISEHFNVEFTGQMLDFDGIGGGVDVDQDSFSFNLVNIYNRAANFSPYVLGGIGWVNSNPEGFQDNDNFQIQGGLGAKTDLGSDRLSLRTEAIYRWEDARGDNFGDWFLNIGLSYALGQASNVTRDSDSDGVDDDRDRCPNTPIGAVVDASGCELDGDNDGVVDRLDECPNTARGAKVNAVGCAIVGDADKDGVADDADQCPGTPAGVAVDATGCPIDADGDGVVNSNDQCPNTAAGVLVDNRGCSFQLEGVNFATNSAQILQEGRNRLNAAGDFLQANPDVRIVIEGHTDSRGDAGYNMRLSESRAEAAKDYLGSRGVAGSRMRAVGFGETQPIADNATKDGQARNRRVVLKVDN